MENGSFPSPPSKFRSGTEEDRSVVPAPGSGAADEVDDGDGREDSENEGQDVVGETGWDGHGHAVVVLELGFDVSAWGYWRWGIYRLLLHVAVGRMHRHRFEFFLVRCSATEAVLAVV